jgi:SAM-dependent methyltransferase
MHEPFLISELNMTDFTYRIHNEKGIDGFTALDGTVKFYGVVRAIMLKTRARRVLDFGAGRGAALADDRSHYRRHLRDLRATGAHVTACDVDDIVETHCASDQQIVIKAGRPLPFADESFEVIVSDMTFEHIENAPFVAGELMRILAPGGYICARTPNKFGYVRAFSGLVPNRLHSRALSSVQPDRKAQDVFPTVYQMNSVRQIRELFPGCHVHYFSDSAEPAYYFGNQLLYRGFLLLHRLLPQALSTTILFFINKPTKLTFSHDA